MGRGWNGYKFEDSLYKDEQSLQGKELATYIRNRNLFYVCCSRPRKRLAILITAEITSQFETYLENVFGSENVISYGEFINCPDWLERYILLSLFDKCEKDTPITGTRSESKIIIMFLGVNTVAWLPSNCWYQWIFGVNPISPLAPKTAGVKRFQRFLLLCEGIKQER